MLKNIKRKTIDYIKSKTFRKDILILFGILCFTSSVFGGYKVPSGSMRPTIFEGDCLLANKISYRLKIPFTTISIFEWKQPDRGDIIAFKNPVDGRPFLKRVIGIPGDKIKMENKRLFINGQKIDISPLRINNGTIVFKENLLKVFHEIQHFPFITRNDKFMLKEIPEGHVFVMGDNRDNSFDSRSWGLVPIKNIYGKIIFRWFAYDRKTLFPRFKRIGKI
jgi:signal peptidase I